MPQREEASRTSTLRLIGIDGKRVRITPPRMLHMIGAAANRTAVPGINDVEDQWRVHGDRWVETRRWLPGAIAHTGNVFMLYAGGMQRQAPPMTGHNVACIRQATDLDLQTFNRRIHVA